jgi:hypothetical protein
MAAMKDAGVDLARRTCRFSTWRSYRTLSTYFHRLGAALAYCHEAKPNRHASEMSPLAAAYLARLLYFPFFLSFLQLVCFIA